MCVILSTIDSYQSRLESHASGSKITLPFQDDLLVLRVLWVSREDRTTNVEVVEHPGFLWNRLHDTLGLHVRIQASAVVLDPRTIDVERV